MNSPANYETTREIRAASRKFVRELDILDGKGCLAALSLSESHLLMELDQLGQATGKQLAGLLLLEKSTVSRLIAKLQSDGVVRAATAAHDRRQKLIELTGHGHDLVARMHRKADLQVDQALAFMTAAQHRGLADALNSYSRALGYARKSGKYVIRPIENKDDPVSAGSFVM